MKLFVRSKVNQQKVYLNLSASTRNDLRIRFNGDYFTVGDGHIYGVHEVYAESESNSTAGGAVIGGLVGVLGGPIGLLLGAGLGGLIGNNSDQDENNRVNAFNRSY
ncbi:MAG: hypothetical protein JSU07_12480 [Bacteroidetes bacterium]|nr:hypothetical protein [Bacteroidota bacterium]